MQGRRRRLIPALLQTLIIQNKYYLITHLHIIMDLEMVTRAHYENVFMLPWFLGKLPCKELCSDVSHTILNKTP